MLTESILVAETATGQERICLPKAFALLCEGSLVAFEGLAAHQAQAWDLFLIQVAAMALERTGETDAAEDLAAWRGLADPAAWRARLAVLTPGCADTAWSLVVEDRHQPALLQPSVGDAAWASYKPVGRTPDEIDILITAKGHDVKPARAGAAEPRHWLYALVTLQTLQGYSGRGNFGIARMNGGFASRPLLMLTPAQDLAGRFRRGVRAALRARTAALAIDRGNFREDGLPLLWLEPWDTDRGLSLADLDPLFVEICRRLRLVRDTDGTITAWFRPSEAACVIAKDAKGNLGDAFTPVGAEGAALTVGAGGFDYRLLSRVLTSPDFEKPAALEVMEDDPAELWLHGVVLVRGQGRTEGLHERWLPVEGRAMRALWDPERSAVIGKAATEMVGKAGEARKALRLGLQVYLQGGTEKVDHEDDRPSLWLDAFERKVDAIFFKHLFARIATDAAESADAAWHAALVGIVRDLFDAALARLSPPEMRRERARALAERALTGVLFKTGLIPPKQETEMEETV